MKITNNIYPDNFNIEFTSVGAKLRYSLKLDKKTAAGICKDNNIIKTYKGTYVYYTRLIVGNATNEHVREAYFTLKKQTMIKCRELKRKVLLQEINYIQTKFNF